jgi:hypothetical protein
MFIPIGGVFMFGNGISPMAGLTTGIINAIMGGLALALGYVYGFMFLIIVGYVIAGLGVLMIILNLIKMKRGDTGAIVIEAPEFEKDTFAAKDLTKN